MSTNKFFTECIRESFVNWHRKFRNMLLVGPSKCSKTYIFKPLIQSFKSKIIWQIFRWQIWFGCCSKIRSNFAAGIQVVQRSIASITWKDLLLLLEEKTVIFLAPKSIYAHNHRVWYCIIWVWSFVYSLVRITTKSITVRHYVCPKNIVVLKSKYWS